MGIQEGSMSTVHKMAKAMKRLNLMEEFDRELRRLVGETTLSMERSLKIEDGNVEHQRGMTKRMSPLEVLAQERRQGC